MSGRARRVLFAAVWVLACAAMATPLVPAAWRPAPLVLGMPPAFAWSLLWLAVMFVAVLWLYHADERGPRARPRD